MIMTQEHDVDGSDHLGRPGGALRLPQHIDRGGVLAATGIEGRVGQQTQPAELEQGRGPTDVGHLEPGATHRRSPLATRSGFGKFGSRARGGDQLACLVGRGLAGELAPGRRLVELQPPAVHRIEYRPQPRAQRR